MKGKAFPGRIIFDHLAKTAGTAIGSWLREVLGAGCVTPNLYGEHSDLIQRYGGLYSVICSHMVFGGGESLDPRYQYITLFRDPIDRAISWIFYVLNDAPEEPDNIALKEGAKQFVESSGRDTTPEFLNSMTNLFTNHFCLINTVPSAGDNDSVEKAFAAVQLYDVVGIYEEMPRFLADVAALIGLPAPESIARLNVTSRRPRVNQITPALRDRIMELNQSDLRLYELVKAWKSAADPARPGASEPVSVAVPRWQKYEPVWNRNIVTPELIVGRAVLREGTDIRHGQLMTFDVDFFLKRELCELQMGINIFDNDRRRVFGIDSIMLGHSHCSVPAGSFRVSHHLLAALPAGKYTAGFDFAEILLKDQKELARHEALCEFRIVNQTQKQFVGSAYLPAEMSLCPTRLARPDAVVINPVGRITVVTPVPPITTGSRTTVGVEVVNQSEQTWLGDFFRPVKFSYHWLKDSGEILRYNGLCTPLPEGGVVAGQSSTAEITVEAPLEAGKHTLILTMLQERVAWFEQIGFEPARIEVEVLPN